MVALANPIYDPTQSFDANFDHGPYGAFAQDLTVNSSGRPSYSFLGFPIYTPFGIPAGPLLNAGYVIAALKAGYDVAVYKTQRSVQFESNPFPNILYVQPSQIWPPPGRIPSWV